MEASYLGDVLLSRIQAYRWHLQKQVLGATKSKERSTQKGVV